MMNVIHRERERIQNSGSLQEDPIGAEETCDKTNRIQCLKRDQT